MEKIVHLGKFSNFVTKPFKSEILSKYYTRYSLGKLLTTVKTSKIKNKKLMFIKFLGKVVILCTLENWKNIPVKGQFIF